MTKPNRPVLLVKFLPYGKSEVVPQGTVKFKALPQVKLILPEAKSVIRSKTLYSNLSPSLCEDFILLRGFHPRTWISSAFGRFHREALLRKASHSFAEALVVNDLTLAQKSDNVVYVGIVAEPEDIVIGDTCLLLCGKVLVEIRERVAL